MQTGPVATLKLEGVWGRAAKGPIVNRCNIVVAYGPPGGALPSTKQGLLRDWVGGASALLQAIWRGEGQEQARHTPNTLMPTSASQSQFTLRGAKHYKSLRAPLRPHCYRGTGCYAGPAVVAEHGRHRTSFAILICFWSPGPGAGECISEAILRVWPKRCPGLICDPDVSAGEPVVPGQSSAGVWLGRCTTGWAGGPAGGFACGPWSASCRQVCPALGAPTVSSADIVPI